MVGWPMSRNNSDLEPKALSLVEQAFHLLRRNSGHALAEYYLGSLPFILALLYFWSDMSRDPMAAWYCGPSSAGVALTFIWMKVWQARFCRRLRRRLQDETPASWSFKRLLCTSARQSFLHACGMVALPVSALIVFPFGWAYAFFQNLSVLDGPQTKEIMSLARAAKEQAGLWPGQNHLILTIMSFFGLLVFFNLTLGILAMPYLLKWLFGIETVFTLSGMKLLNTTFIAVLCGLTYLCTDPIIKTVYVLRCFYGRSRLTGDDMRSALRPFLKSGLSALLVSVCLVSSPVWVSAQETGENSSRPAATDEHGFAVQLDDAIASVLQERRFAWRLPRRPAFEAEAEPGWIAGTIQWIADGVRTLARLVGRWIKAFIEWLKQKMPDPSFSRLDDGQDYRGLIRWIFFALGFGLALLLVCWLVRWLIHNRVPAQTESDPGQSDSIDLADERITAEDLPLDQWIAMAVDLLRRDDFRSALRALYLSVLALLADRQRVTIARYKSNLDYAHELARRAHAEPELLAAFEWCVRIFERAWYGMHPVSRPQVEDFMNQQQRITDLVQRAA
jgi:hypothetical protein